MTKLKLIAINTVILILFGVVIIVFHNNKLDLHSLITMQLMQLYVATFMCINIYKQKGKVAYLVFLCLLMFQMIIYYKFQYQNIWRY